MTAALEHRAPSPKSVTSRKIVFGDLVPGETPIDDFSGLKVRGITTRGELNAFEAMNIGKVLVDYFGRSPTKDVEDFGLEWARDLHGEMFGDVWDWAGRFRTRDVNLGVPFAQVPESLFNLLENLKVWRSSAMDLIEQAARLHHGAVQIHPFINGNGRWGRMLANIWLDVHGSPVVGWPETLIGSVSPIRDNYIMALKTADCGEIEPLLEMHRAHLQDDSKAAP
jgi:Fic-DOC domain mobile mystery protein B